MVVFSLLFVLFFFPPTARSIGFRFSYLVSSFQKSFILKFRIALREEDEERKSRDEITPMTRIPCLTLCPRALGLCLIVWYGA